MHLINNLHRNGAQSLSAAVFIAAVAGTALAQPSLSSIYPASGSTQGGNILRLQGTNLLPTAAVFVGGNGATVLAATGAEMYVLCPAGDGIARPVQVIDMGASSNTIAYNYDAPTVTSVTPAMGPTAGGAIITVRGKDFGLAPSVSVGGAPASTSIASQTQIICTLPVGAGANQQVVVNAGGQSSPPARFDYSPPVINSITPQSVSTAGGTFITITGSNFGSALPSVLIDGKAASVQTSGQSQILVSSPPGEGSVVEVEVVVAGQVSPPALLSYDPPAIFGIITPPGGAPTSGGVLLTIQGQNFGPQPSVTVGGAAAPLSGAATHSLIVCTIPEGEGSNVAVTVKARDQFSNAVPISYSPPLISGVSGSPSGNTLPSSGGTLLTITGQNFGRTSNKLFVGGLPLTNVQHDPATPHTKLTAQTPPGLGRGHPLAIIVGDQVAYFGSPLHFDMPVCPGDSDGDGIVDFDDITSSLANWASSCP